MAENSKIEWTHHTFNPWRGCTKVSAGCKHCYAETLSGRNPGTLGIWGKHGTRVIASESYWRQPLKWNRDAERAGERRRVFCASLADVFEGPESMPAEAWPLVQAARARLFELIKATPWLDWLLLTKRPKFIAVMLPADWDQGYPNVWLGTSVENQAAADKRIPELLAVPAAVRFLSCEPLLGPVDLSAWLWEEAGPEWAGRNPAPGIDWVIAGGESGGGARPMHPNWARGLRDQCVEAGVAFLFKQWGEYIPITWRQAFEDKNPKPSITLNCDGSSVYTQVAHLIGARDEGDVCMERVGKKAAGRVLDGRIWDEYPKAEAPHEA